MSTNVLHYHNDGANRQAQACLALFQYLLSDGIESSWSDKWKQYEANIQIARWENCREQGYVLSLRTGDFRKQLNIAFYEHRNVDSLCAVQWEQATLNSPTLDTADFGEVFKDKYDTSFDANKHCEVKPMAEWMLKEFISFWNEHAK